MLLLCLWQKSLDHLIEVFETNRTLHVISKPARRSACCCGLRGNQHSIQQRDMALFGVIRAQVTGISSLCSRISREELTNNQCAYGKHI